MRRRIPVLLALLLLARPALAAKLAVLDVRTMGSVSKERVEGLSSLIASDVARSRVGEVLSGSDLRAMLGFERQRELSGCGDAGCLAEIGGALGVDYLVSSEVSVVGSTWLLSMSLVDIRRARVASRLTRQTSSDNELVGLSGEAIAELLEPLRVGQAGPPSKLPAYIVWGLGLVAAAVGTGELIDSAGKSSHLLKGTSAPPSLTKTAADDLAVRGIPQRNLGWGLVGGAAVLGLVGLLLHPGADAPPPLVRF